MKPLDPKSLQGAKEPHGVAPARGLSRKAQIIGLAVLLAIGALGWWFLSGTTKPAPPPRRVAIAVAQAQVKDMPYRVEAPGAVQPVISVQIRTRVDSMVEKVLLKLSRVARSSASTCSLNQLKLSGCIAPAAKFMTNRLASAAVG